MSLTIEITMSPKRVNDLFLSTYGIQLIDESLLQHLEGCRSLRQLSLGINRFKEITVNDTCPVGTFLFILKQSFRLDVTGFLSPYPKSLALRDCHKFKIPQGEMVCHNLPIGRNQMKEYIDKLSTIVPTEEEIYIIQSVQVYGKVPSLSRDKYFTLLTCPRPWNNFDAVNTLNKFYRIDIKKGMRDMFRHRLHPVFGFPSEDLYSLPFKVLLPADLSVDDVTVNTYFENWDDTMVLTSMTVSPKKRKDKRVFDVILPKEFDYLRIDSTVI
jgi:hypothetical protein